MRKKLPDWFAKKRLYNSNINVPDKEIILWEVLNIKSKQYLKVRFISTNSKYRQGIRLALDTGKGSITINGITGRDFDLWEDECPKEFEVECISNEGYLSVYNIYEKKDWTGGKSVYSQMAYSGMILEQKGNIYRYKCNDSGDNIEFDKLIFEIELL